MKNLVSFIVGLLFAIGLGLSGMTQTHIVKGFLDIFGQWNMNLMGVMIGAIVVHGIAYQFIKRRSAPLLETKFYLPQKTTLDRRLLLGAALFGVGWGWAGICPGPAFVSLIDLNLSMIIFVVSMLIGMLIYKWLAARFSW